MFHFEKSFSHITLKSTITIYNILRNLYGVCLSIYHFAVVKKFAYNLKLKCESWRASEIHSYLIAGFRSICRIIKMLRSLYKMFERLKNSHIIQTVHLGQSKYGTSSHAVVCVRKRWSAGVLVNTLKDGMNPIRLNGLNVLGCVRLKVNESNPKLWKVDDTLSKDYCFICKLFEYLFHFSSSFWPAQFAKFNSIPDTLTTSSLFLSSLFPISMFPSISHAIRVYFRKLILFILLNVFNGEKCLRKITITRYTSETSILFEWI